MFSIKSMYDHLTRDESFEPLKFIWKAKIPQKIKIFMWLIHNNAILTRDNLIKRKWPGDASCVFCNDLESIDHIFFLCPVAKVIWGVIATSFGASIVPLSFSGYSTWINQVLASGDSVFMLGVAVICWAIWKTRNAVIF